MGRLGELCVKCMIYVMFAGVVFLIDITIWSEALLFSIQKDPQLEIHVMATVPNIIWLGIVMVIDRWLDRIIKSQFLEQIRANEKPSKALGKISFIRNIAVVLWAYVIFVYVDAFWIGILHIGLLINAVYVVVGSKLLAKE